MNRRALPTGFTISKSNIDGLGLFATQDLVTMPTAVTHIRHPALGWMRTALGAFINHSETPNCITKGDQMRLKTTEAVVAFDLAWTLLGTHDNINNGPLIEVRYLIPCSVIGLGEEITLFYGDKIYHAL